MEANKYLHWSPGSLREVFEAFWKGSTTCFETEGLEVWTTLSHPLGIYKDTLVKLVSVSASSGKGIM